MKTLRTILILTACIVEMTSCSYLPDKQAAAENEAWEAESASMTQSAMANQQLRLARLP